MPAPRLVLLIHGMHMKPFSMWSLAKRLRRAGLDVQAFSYPSVRGHLDVCAGALIDVIQAHAGQLKEGQRIALVGHSLGGLVAARALQLQPQLPVGDLVMLGVPYRGAQVAINLQYHHFGEMVVGKPLRQWINRRLDKAALPEHVRVYAIAGSKSKGLGRLVHRFKGDNDGTVYVQESQVPGARDNLVLPVSHSGMLFSQEVADRLLSWLHQSTADLQTA